MKRRGQTKVKICISIDETRYKKLKEYCDKNLIKLSTYIDYLIEKGMKK